MKYWESLLTEWNQQGGTGLTIPFIIGSQKFLNKDNSFHDIAELFEDIVKNGETKLYISYCFDIKDLILGINGNSAEGALGHYPPFDNLSQTQIFCSAFVKNLGADVETIVINLSEKYQNFIDAGEFSQNDGQKGDYTADDIVFIKKCFLKIK